MRAYLLGYTHGKNDVCCSSLIKYGTCEKSYDESLDVEYVSIDTALEIIDNICEDFCTEELNCVPLITRVAEIRKAVETLIGGEQE